jgi:putative glycosyltransferase (TIGR04372 family)
MKLNVYGHIHAIRRGEIAKVTAEFAKWSDQNDPAKVATLAQMYALEARRFGYSPHSFLQIYGASIDRLEWEKPRKCVILPSFTYHRIGHMATHLGALAHLQSFGFLSDFKFLMFTDKSCNDTYLNLWGNRFPLYRTLEALRSGEGESIYQFSSAYLPWFDGIWRDTGEVYVLAELESRRRQLRMRPLAHPLLDKPKVFMSKLDDRLPPDAPFVCLHVRSSAYRGSEIDHNNRHRNNDILSYELAVREIAKLGLWTIRIGDKDATPLPPWPNCIDARGSTGLFDIACISACEFFLGDSSGPVMVASTFGKPIIATNLEFGAGSAVFDLHLPKLIRKRGGDFIPFSSLASSRLNFCVNADILDELNAEVAPNTPEEIRDAIGDLISSSSELQGRYLSCFPQDQASLLGKIAPSFASKWRRLLI